MAKNNPLLDTNLIIRFLTQDNKEQAKRVEKLFTSKNTIFEITDLVIAEIIFVLLSVYNLPKNDIVEKMSLLTEFEKIECNKKVLKTALDCWSNHPISFIDAYLLALATVEKNSCIYSFDNKLIKIKKI